MPVLIGLVLTLLWITFSIWFIRENNHWKDVFELKPDAFGNMSAGISAPLAFLWLVVAVFMQRQELSLQREELRLNRKALELQIVELKTTSEQMLTQNNLQRADTLDRRQAAEFQTWQHQLTAKLHELTSLEQGMEKYSVNGNGRTQLFAISPIGYIDLEDLSVNLIKGLRSATKTLSDFHYSLINISVTTCHPLIHKSTVLRFQQKFDEILKLSDDFANYNNPQIVKWQKDVEFASFIAEAKRHFFFLASLSTES